MSEESFDSWAIVELFGHSKIAGRVTEASIGGCSFLRVDVPETERRQAFTRMFGNGAIYALNPVSEEVALMAAAEIDAQPVKSWDLDEGMLKTAAKNLMRRDPDFAAQLAPPGEEAEFVDDIPI